MKKIGFLILYFLSLQAYGMDVYCDGAPTTIQANGGGNVALTAIVDSTVFVGPNASVCEYATVLGNSQINDSARVYGYARVSNGTIISGTAEVFGNAVLTSNTTTPIIKVSDASKIFGNAIVLEGATIKATSRVFENARVSGNATIDETAQVYGSATVTGTAIIKGASRIHGTAYMGSNIVATGTSTDICVITHYPSNTILTNIVNCTSNPPLESTSQIAAGEYHTCVLLANGRLRCWGFNNNGQLGNGLAGSIGDNELPKTAPYTALGVGGMAAGLNHTCSITLGSARCWGAGSLGQLGNGLPNDIHFPDAVINLGGEAVAQIAAGNAHTCALLSSGKVRCWGDNVYGQLGYGNTTRLFAPGGNVDLGDNGSGPGSMTAIQIVAGSFHTCALLSTMEVRCWGRGAEGQLGSGSVSNIGANDVPGSKAIVNFDDIGHDKAIQIVAGVKHTCVLTINGNVRCWGLNDIGQLGYGNTFNIGDDEAPAVAGDITLGGPVLKLSSGLGNHTCAILANATGSVYCWGSNNLGQLGYGNTNNVGDDESPFDVGEVSVGGVVTQITTGESHTCALLSTKGVRCWGDNHLGQLGYGNTTNIGDNELPSSVGNVQSQFVKNNKKNWRRNEK